jgi:hypothetical protein
MKLAAVVPRRTGLGLVMTTRSLSQTVGPICELAVAATLAIAISIIVLVVLCHDVVRPRSASAPDVLSSLSALDQLSLDATSRKP